MVGRLILTIPPPASVCPIASLPKGGEANAAISGHPIVRGCLLLRLLDSSAIRVVQRRSEEVEEGLRAFDRAPRRVLDGLKKMIALRRCQSAFHPEGKHLFLTSAPTFS